MNAPIIRLEVEGMRHTIIAALTEHQAAMDKDIMDAVNAYVTPENLRSIIHVAAEKALGDAIKAEVQAFFSCGDGRKAVAAAVKESLLKNETYTLLDTV